MDNHILSGETVEKFIKKIKSMKKDQWVIAFLTGVLLLIIVIPVDKQDEADAAQTAKEAESSLENTTSDSGYQAELEQRLEEILSTVDGAGQVRVMITFADDGEVVVEKDTPVTSQVTTETDSAGGTRQTTESESTETTVLAESENGTTPYVISELAPTVEGVLVVAQGGADETVAQNISDAVLALFPIEANKVKVVKMNM